MSSAASNRQEAVESQCCSRGVRPCSKPRQLSQADTTELPLHSDPRAFQRWPAQCGPGCEFSEGSLSYRLRNLSETDTPVSCHRLLTRVIVFIPVLPLDYAFNGT